MGEMRDSDWSRENLLRSDWSVPKGAIMTTYGHVITKFFRIYTLPNCLSYGATLAPA